MPTFIHTADWQIGRQYSRFAEDDGAVLADARFSAIERIAELAAEHKVDAVLVAGDVFDAQTVSDRTIHRTFDAMQGFTGLWLLLPGNHDAALAESVWTRAERMNAVPDNTRLLLDPGMYDFAEQGFAVIAAPLTQRQTFHDLTAVFEATESPTQRVRIGLAHGSITGILPDAVDSTNPIAPDRAQSARLDYLALGDWHGMKQINERTWYSGTPEPERFKANDAGYALLVSIPSAGDAAEVTPLFTAQHRWFSLASTLMVASDVEELEQVLSELPPKSVIELTLDGQLDLNSQHQLTQLLSRVAGRHRSLDVRQDALRVLPTDADLAALQADGYVGEVIDTLKNRQQEQDDDTARDALVILAGLLRDQAEGSRT